MSQFTLQHFDVHHSYTARCVILIIFFLSWISYLYSAENGWWGKCELQWRVHEWELKELKRIYIDGKIINTYRWRYLYFIVESSPITELREDDKEFKPEKWRLDGPDPNEIKLRWYRAVFCNHCSEYLGISIIIRQFGFDLTRILVY